MFSISKCEYFYRTGLLAGSPCASRGFETLTATAPKAPPGPYHSSRSGQDTHPWPKALTPEGLSLALAIEAPTGSQNELKTHFVWPGQHFKFVINTSN